MDANSTLQKRKHHRDLWQLLVLSAQSFDRVLINFTDRLSFVLSAVVTVLERHGELLALTLAEGEDDDGVEAFRRDESDELAHLLLGCLFLLLLFVLLFFGLLGDRHVVFDHLDSLREVVFAEGAFFVND